MGTASSSNSTSLEFKISVHDDVRHVGHQEITVRITAAGRVGHDVAKDGPGTVWLGRICAAENSISPRDPMCSEEACARVTDP